MTYIIDGHNLIPKIPGFGLEQIDDEIQLIELLSRFAGRMSKNVVVFFDNAPPGFSGIRMYGRVSAYFTRQGRTADEAIRGYLNKQAKGAKQFILVSSDLSLQITARQVRARVISSEDFARQLFAVLEMKSGSAESYKEAKPSDGEIAEWLKIFNDKGGKT
jgi:predicted RNA-binding protein with PIN domain